METTDHEVRTMPGQISDQKPPKPPVYKRGWFLFLAACIGSGLIAGLAVPLSYVLTLAGFFGAVGCLVWLIVRAVRRREVRRPALYLALCLAVWLGAGSQVPNVQTAIDADAATETRTEQETAGGTRPSLSDKVAEAKAEPEPAPVKTGEAEEPVLDAVPEPESAPEPEPAPTPEPESAADFKLDVVSLSIADIGPIDTGNLKLKFGDLQGVNYGGDGVVVVKAKIKSNLTNQMTIDQNYHSVCELITDSGFDTCSELQYWAVADMTNGSEAKVISFTVPKSTIDAVKAERIYPTQLADYVEDLWIHPSLV